MWKPSQLCLPRSHLITGGGNASFSFKGSKFAVHNWTHGKTEASGKFLSPENAMRAVQSKFSDYDDPNRPQEAVDAVLLLVTDTNVGNFIQRLEALALLLNYSEVKQALAYAKGSQTLEASKMTRPQTIRYPNFSQGADLTPPIGRMMNALQSSTPSATNPPDPFALIAQLKAQKQAKAEAQAKQQKALANVKATVWAFADRGFLDMLAERLFDNLPTAENVYSFALVFVGENLQPLKAMLQK